MLCSSKPTLCVCVGVVPLGVWDWPKMPYWLFCVKSQGDGTVVVEWWVTDGAMKLRGYCRLDFLVVFASPLQDRHWLCFLPSTTSNLSLLWASVNGGRLQLFCNHSRPYALSLHANWLITCSDNLTNVGGPPLSTKRYVAPTWGSLRYGICTGKEISCGRGFSMEHRHIWLTSVSRGLWSNEIKTNTHH